MPQSGSPRCLDLPCRTAWAFWMVAATGSLTAALLLSFAIVGALHLDSDWATAPVFLPLLIVLTTLGQRWILSYRLCRAGRWLIANVVSFFSLIPLVWSFQRCLGMECFINLSHMLALILVGVSVCAVQWLMFRGQWRWAGVALLGAALAGLGLGLAVGPRLSGLIELVLIGIIPGAVTGLWVSCLLVRQGRAS
ncbi:MAG TPA: hypothetical protein PK954_19120, partial [Anaerolineales bacterium]|nr:hypothetical protein [Anaerolineales bacterium]